VEGREGIPLEEHQGQVFLSLPIITTIERKSRKPGKFKRKSGKGMLVWKTGSRPGKPCKNYVRKAGYNGS
jgi:hypothetical protein